MNAQQKLSSLISGMLLVSLLGCIGQGKTGYYNLQAMVQAVDANKIYIPLAVIGSGPAGISAAMYGANAGMPTVVFEGNKPGGLLTETTYVENWPGIKSTRGPVIMETIKDQAQGFGVLFVNDSIDSVDFAQWPFVLHTELGHTYHALSVVIATGASPSVLSVPGEQEYWGVGGVNTCAVCHAPLYKGLHVAVVGGGDSAIEEAIQLSSYAKQVTILVRKGTMRASDRMQKLLSGYPNITVRYYVEVQKINGDGNNITGVQLYNHETKSTEDMVLDGLFLAIGHDPNTKLFKGQVPLDAQGYIEPIGRTQCTTIPGVFAAGEVTDKVYRQAGISAGQGSIAGIDAANFLKELGFNALIEQTLKPYLFTTQRAEKKNVVTVVQNMDEWEEKVVRSTLPVIVDFYADYCPSCMQMLPAFQAAAQQFEGKVSFVKIDTETATDVAEKMYVLRVPTMLIMKNGQVAARYNETMTFKELVEFVQKFVS
jgi:thioredoxin reductase (NADPH)